jgi:septal ring factor EnvC (AmiA/AmiB activator)
MVKKKFILARINRKPAEKTIENEILKNKIKELEETLEDMKAKDNDNLREQQNIAEHFKTQRAQNLQRINDLELTINEKEKQLCELSENYKVKSTNAEQLQKNFDSVRSKMGIQNQEIAKLTEKNLTLERRMDTERSEFKQKQEEFKTKILENEEKLVFEKKEAKRKVGYEIMIFILRLNI